MFLEGLILRSAWAGCGVVLPVIPDIWALEERPPLEPGAGNWPVRDCEILPLRRKGCGSVIKRMLKDLALILTPQLKEATLLSITLMPSDRLGQFATLD